MGVRLVSSNPVMPLCISCYAERRVLMVIRHCGKKEARPQNDLRTWWYTTKYGLFFRSPRIINLEISTGVFEAPPLEFESIWLFQSPRDRLLAFVGQNLSFPPSFVPDSLGVGPRHIIVFLT